MKYQKSSIYFLTYSFFASSSAIIFALYYQYFENFQPCSFCIYQRIPYILIIFVFLTYLIFKRKKYFFENIILFLFFTSLIISTTHFGIEQGFWTFKTSCTNEIEDFDNIEQLRLSLMEVPIAKCDEILWSYKGISMAGYNVLFSLINVLLSIFYRYKVRS